MSDSTAPPNRRCGERHLACFPASLERADGEQRPSLIRDLSETGVLLLVRTTKVTVGDRVKLQLYITEDSDTHRVAEGQVVRVEEVGPDDAGPWLRRWPCTSIGTTHGHGRRHQGLPRARHPARILEVSGSAGPVPASGSGSALRARRGSGTAPPSCR